MELEIEIIQKGRKLPSHTYQGKRYVEAPESGEYVIQVTNNTRRAPGHYTGRQLAVIAVDGLNVISGETAGYDGPGYCLLPGCTINIPGWWRDNGEVAAFEFKAKDESYTAQMGNGSSNTGVIGLAGFRERDEMRQDLITDLYSRPRSALGSATKGIPISAGGCSAAPVEAVRGEGGVARNCNYVSEVEVAGGAAAACSMDLESESRSKGVLRSAARSLGTGYGAKKTMHTSETTFKRYTTDPTQVTSIQYATRAKLIEWGIPLPAEVPSPSAFPAEVRRGVAAPPNWVG